MNKTFAKSEIQGNETSFSPPSRPSLRGRIATRMVRVVVKHWAKGDPPAVVRRARRIFGLPNFMNALHSLGLEIERVEGRSVQPVAAGQSSGQPAGGEWLRGEWIRPRQSLSSDCLVLYLHGGGYVSCSAKTHRPITTALARLLQSPVFALDYRLAPEHPFPAAVDDAAAAFQWLVAGGVRADKIAIVGDSAGGGLALAAILRLRELGHALPACAVGLAPWVDLTGAGRYRNSGSCSMFQPSDVAVFAELYLHDIPAQTPEASPLFADLRGFPPLLTHASSTELLLDDALRLHEKATSCGVNSTLTVYPGLPHVWHILIGLIPEARMALEQVASFVSAAWRGSPMHQTTGGNRRLPSEPAVPHTISKKM